MALTKRIFVEFLADIRRGEISKKAIEDGLAAAGFTNQITHSVVPVFSPISGTLTGASVTVPVADAAQVEGILLTILGALVGPALPLPLFLSDVTAMSLATLVLAGDAQIAVFAADDAFTAAFTLAVLRTAGFLDFAINTTGKQFGIFSVEEVDGPGYTLPIGDLTITDVTAGVVVPVLASPIVLPAPAFNQRNADFYYMDEDKKIYLASRVIDSITVLGPRSFSDAFDANPTGL